MSEERTIMLHACHSRGRLSETGTVCNMSTLVVVEGLQSAYPCAANVRRQPGTCPSPLPPRKHQVDGLWLEREGVDLSRRVGLLGTMLRGGGEGVCAVNCYARLRVCTACWPPSFGYSTTPCDQVRWLARGQGGDDREDRSCTMPRAA